MADITFGRLRHGQLPARFWRLLVGRVLLGTVLIGAGIAAAPPSPVSVPTRAIAPFDASKSRAHQDAWARHLKTTVEEKCALGMVLVLIPPGEFLMGSTPEQMEGALKWLATLPRAAPGEAERIRTEEQPRHRVILTRPLRVAATEVTIGQYRRFVAAIKYITETERFGGGNSSKTEQVPASQKPFTWQTPGYPVTDQSPVTQLTWNDMIAFCNWFSEQEKRQACYRQYDKQIWVRIPDATGYRLPTEAEWEFACRAGTTTHYAFGDDVAELAKYGWYNKNAEQGDRFGAAAVASKLPNPFGLYDMHGNVWERCQDFWAADWYGKSPVEDPQGPPSGSHRIVRGGGWHYFDLHARSAYRNHYALVARTGNTGFRVVRSP